MCMMYLICDTIINYYSLTYLLVLNKNKTNLKGIVLKAVKTRSKSTCKFDRRD